MSITRRLFRVIAVFLLLALSGLPATASESTKPVNLSVTQTDTPDPVIENGFVTYAVVVSNGTQPGTQPANTVIVSLSTSAGQFVSGSGHRWVCSLGVTTATCEHKGAIEKGSSAQVLSVVVQAPSATVASEINHTAVVSTIYPEYSEQAPADNTDSENTRIQPGADLTVDQIDEPDPVGAGNTIRYLITATNNSNANSAMSVKIDTTASFGSVTDARGAGWTCTEIGGTASCSYGTPLAPNSASSLLEVLVLTPENSVGQTLSHTAKVSSATGDTNPGNNTHVEPTFVAAQGNGTARGYIPPEGGQVTTCGTSGPTSGDTTCTTATFPAGPGGIATLIEGPQLDVCAAVGCAGGSVDVIVPDGYDPGVTPAIVVNLFVDVGTADPADDPTREVYVQKIVQGGEVETLAVPSCTARVPGLPCVRSHERVLITNDLLVKVEMFSGDPIFEVGDGLNGG